jgi:integrase/recombinase XerD
LDRIRKPQPPRKKSPRLKKVEITAVLQGVKKHTQQPIRNLAMVKLMLDSGLRRGEVCNLTVSDLDQERQCVRVFGKDKEERDIPVSDETLETIQKWLEVRPSVDHDYMFVTRSGAPMTGNALSLMIYRIKKKTGISVYCHLFRHTFADYYIKHGGSLRRLQDILGHGDITTTADIYVNPDFPEIQEEHSRVSPLANLD